MDSDLLSPRVIAFRAPVASAAPRSRNEAPVVLPWPATPARVPARPAQPDPARETGGSVAGILGDAATIAIMVAAGLGNAWLLLAAFGVRVVP